MTLYLSRRKLFGAWLLFTFGVVSTIAAILLSASFSSSKSSQDFLFLVLVLPCLGIMWLGMYALKQIYSCPRCGTCIIKNVLLARLKRQQQTTCPDCLQNTEIVMER